MIFLANTLFFIFSYSYVIKNNNNKNKTKKKLFFFLLFLYIKKHIVDTINRRALFHVGEMFQLALTFTTLWANSADNNLIFFYFFLFQKTGFDISCKLSPQQINCMKSQNLFSGETKKKCFNMLSTKNFTQSAKH